MGSHWGFSDSRSLQDFTTLLRILADLNNAVVWIDSTHTLISKSSSSCTNPFVTVLSAPIISLPCSIAFSVFWQGLRTYLAFNFFILPCGPPEEQSPLFGWLSFFLLTLNKSVRLVDVKWSVCISKSQRILCILFFRTDSGLSMYHLFVWSHLNFLHNSQWNTIPNQSCLVLYSFCANLLHSLIMGWIVLSISPRNVHLLFVSPFLFLL